MATSEAKRTTLYRWVRRLNEEKTKQVHHEACIVGMNIDNEIAELMQMRMNAGLTCDYNILRETI